MHQNENGWQGECGPRRHMTGHTALTQEHLSGFRSYLIQNEKRKATVQKYVRDVRRFLDYLGGDDVPAKRTERTESTEITKERVLQYKMYLEQHFRPESANSMLAALHAFLKFLGREDCRVKTFQIQRRMFRDEERELSRAEYEKLVAAVRREGKERIALIMETIGCTGMRVGELPFVTVEALHSGKLIVNNKGKSREICLISELRKKLLRYCREQGLTSGSVFVSRNGKPLHRSQIWKEMKKAGRRAGIRPAKVFPHNLRHLFARAYYKKHKNVCYLADILGHSSVDTTRIYTATTGIVHRRMMQSLHLLI